MFHKLINYFSFIIIFIHFIAVTNINKHCWDFVLKFVWFVSIKCKCMFVSEMIIRHAGVSRRLHQ